MNWIVISPEEFFTEWKSFIAKGSNVSPTSWLEHEDELDMNDSLFGGHNVEYLKHEGDIIRDEVYRLLSLKNKTY
jgi:hypothetical protein